MSENSVWPFTVAAGAALIGFGVVGDVLFGVIGGLLVAWGLVGWIRELDHG